MRGVAFRLAALSGSLLVCEVALIVGARLSPVLALQLTAPWQRKVRVPDPELGWRMVPHYPGNDAWGFRNPRVPGRADILALGDSMTYGFAAPADRCWPRELERLSGRTVYNMSCGGYSPVEYRALLSRGLLLNPSLVIVALFTGNDAAEAYRAVYIEQRGQGLRLDDEVVDRIGARTAVDRPTGFVSLNDRAAPVGAPQREISGVRRWLSAHSSLYALARAVNTTQVRGNQGLAEDAADHAFEMSAGRPSRYVFDADPFLRTVFLDAALTQQAFDLDDARIRAGTAIIQGALLSIAGTVGAKGVSLFVVLFPTKETVYEPLMRSRQGSAPPAYFELVANERRLTAELEDFLLTKGIRFLNLTDALQSTFGRGAPPFPQSDNTHPNARGYAAAANAIALALAPGRRPVPQP